MSNPFGRPKTTISLATTTVRLKLLESDLRLLGEYKRRYGIKCRTDLIRYLIRTYHEDKKVKPPKAKIPKSDIPLPQEPATESKAVQVEPNPGPCFEESELTKALANRLSSLRPSLKIHRDTLSNQ